MKIKKTMMSWSTGKDSAWALYRLLHDHRYQVDGLFCTINKVFARTAMHAVRLELLQLQAERLQLPLDIIEIPYPCSNAEYESIMRGFVEAMRGRGIECCAFGDLFLEDIRDYRVRRLQGSGIEAVFPVWGCDTAMLSRQMIDAGQRALITCVDPKQLAADFCGREFDRSFLVSLPDAVDPCGENGEFHSFVYDSPIFSSAIPIDVGDRVDRDGFVFRDVLPAAITDSQLLAVDQFSEV